MLNQQSILQVKKQTLGMLVDAIEFSKSKKRVLSETDSISSNPSSHSIDVQGKQKTKSWSEEQIQVLKGLINKFGTDFHILSCVLTNKTKNQIKNKYKQLMAIKKKQNKAQQIKLMTMVKMFQEVQQKQQQN